MSTMIGPAAWIQDALKRGITWAFAAGVLAGCAALAKRHRHGSATRFPAPARSAVQQISSYGYRLLSLPDNRDAPDLLVSVAFSGGGGKAVGRVRLHALNGMRDLIVPTRAGLKPLLDEVDVISGASGGSFTAAYYGLHRDQASAATSRTFSVATPTPTSMAFTCCRGTGPGWSIPMWH